MSIINSFKKTFKLGDYSDESWATAKEVYGVEIANELRDLDGRPTALMTEKEEKAYNVVALSNMADMVEATSMLRMTDERREMREKRKQYKEAAKVILDCGNYDKWSERLEKYRNGVRDFNESKPSHEDFELRVNTESLDGESDYETLARIFFEVSLDFTNRVGEYVAKENGIDKLSEGAIMTATTFGTLLYKLAARLACDRLSLLYPKQTDYKKEYTLLTHAFAVKLEEQDDLFRQSIEHFDKQESLKTLEGVARDIQQDLDIYIEAINEAINKWLDEEPDGIDGLSYKQTVLSSLKRVQNDFLRNPWENNPWVKLTREICGDELAEELTHEEGMEGHGSMLRICTPEEMKAGQVLLEAEMDPMSYDSEDVEEAHQLLYGHSKEFWKKRWMLEKAGLGETFREANESEKDNKARWAEYEEFYGKTVSAKLRAINKYCPGWLVNKVIEEEGETWEELRKKKAAFWQEAFEKYSDEMATITEQNAGRLNK